MRTLFLTLDYELYGNGSGDVFHHIIEPTDRILKIAEKYNGNFLFSTEEDVFRLNIACPKTTLLDGLQRLQQGITHFINLL